MAPTTLPTRTQILVPAVLAALLAALLAIVLTSPPRTPPVPLGASAGLDGGLARIHGVVPTEADGWSPPTPAAALASPPGEGVHRVRILLELTAMGDEGLSFDPSGYSVSALGTGTWQAVWFSPASAVAPQGESIDAVLIFELPDRAIDLTLNLPGGAGLSLGAGHHRGG
ncbi:hypothetical protein [Arthrobacter zhaoguopingii]|uniref:hypothetical protein n=1 Tax=Arthrobacter zhaoguopingii TaxID=2681491 RepID=UPI0013592C1C|nr:hypothetical protein [Arthrobacter zhaoguopingii]